jgi:hypothetical protein
MQRDPPRLDGKDSSGAEKLSDEMPVTKTCSTLSPKADCFDFAKLYWKKTDRTAHRPSTKTCTPTLRTATVTYDRNAVPVKTLTLLLLLQGSVTNKTPHKSIHAADAWNFVNGHYAQAETEKLRSIEDKDARRKYRRPLRILHVLGRCSANGPTTIWWNTAATSASTSTTFEDIDALKRTPPGRHRIRGPS